MSAAADPPARAPLDADAIRRRIPHRGPMALLERAEAWDATTLCASLAAPTAAGHPLRTRHGVLAPVAIELAAQAAALHQALQGEAAGGPAAPRPGFIASVRDVRLHRLRLDGGEARLEIRVERVLAAERQAQYRFVLREAPQDAAQAAPSAAAAPGSAATPGVPLVDGRLTVVLDTPLAVPAPERGPE
ncbi:hypothetical protein [Piscinibacter sakaiensis]|uniref:3-hydroxyacyl-[acyl-carrier-protein] dehydratase n=1 Tax=Piscinibacter sakaiensis TaxID=1547922 RepID=A0A0K8P3S7_PISS1|nr:hypothetical protein [Piscinibacter sakaiensis]GAP37298.1 hypothetical protein ISF6_3153 [Piscinibacter sakaiensis]